MREEAETEGVSVSEGQLTLCENAFAHYQRQLPKMAEYMRSVIPYLAQNRTGIDIFADSVFVLMFAWHEQFLKSLVSSAIRYRQTQAREYLSKSGKPADAQRALDCDFPTLMSIGRGRVSFRKGAAPVERLITALFGFSVWPNDDVRNHIIDLNVLRQLIVHHSGSNVGDSYWDQVSDKSILKTKQYGDRPPIRSINYEYCVMEFMLRAFEALDQQSKYVRGELLKRPEWVWHPEKNPLR